MNCRYSENDIALYVEGDVTSATACEIQAHLTTCSRCETLFVELQESQAALKQLRQDVAGRAALVSVRVRVLAEIQNEVRPIWGRRWVYALAGSMLVAVIGLGLHMHMQPGRSPVPEVAKTDTRVVPSTFDNRLLETTTPPAPVKEASRHLIHGRSHPSLAKEGSIAPADIPAERQQPKQLVVKLLTDDPNIVIYWLVDQTGGAL
jgi:Putative zinc-finger